MLLLHIQSKKNVILKWVSKPSKTDAVNLIQIYLYNRTTFRSDLVDNGNDPNVILRTLWFHKIQNNKILIK